MEAVGGVLSAFGLAASAGLNAYVPLLLVALVARLTDWIELGSTWEPVTSWWVIADLRSTPAERGNHAERVEA